MLTRFRQWMRGHLGARPGEVTVVIPWLAPIRAMVVGSAFAIVWGRIWDQANTASPAFMAGFLAVVSVGGSIGSRSTARHRIVTVVDCLVLIIAPVLAVHLLPQAYRHEWYAAYPASFTAAIFAVYAYVAVSRLPGFGPLAPPVDESEQPAFVVRPWTPDERAVLLGVTGRTIFRRSYPIVVNVLAFAFVTLMSFGFALGALADDAWAIGVIISVICVFFGRTALRAFRVAVIADADGITVRNLQWTHRVAWGYIQRIVPPSADQYRYLRIDRLHGGPIRCTALAKSVFQRKRALDHYADELAELIGPQPEPIELAGTVDLTVFTA